MTNNNTTPATTLARRESAIAKAFNVPFDPADYSNDWSPMKKAIAQLIDEIASTERMAASQLQMAARTVQNAVDAVERVDGSINSIDPLCMTNASHYLTKLSFQRNTLATLAAALRHTES